MSIIKNNIDLLVEYFKHLIQQFQVYFMQIKPSRTSMSCHHFLYSGPFLCLLEVVGQTLITRLHSLQQGGYMLLDVQR